MNKIARMLAVTGLSLLAGASFSAGPAMAATSADTGASKTAVAGHGWGGSREDVVIDFFDSRGECYAVGYRGERWDRWEDFDCIPVRGGDWALVADFDNDWDGRWPGYGWSGGWRGNYGHFPHRSFYFDRFPGRFNGPGIFRPGLRPGLGAFGGLRGGGFGGFGR